MCELGGDGCGCASNRCVRGHAPLTRGWRARASDCLDGWRPYITVSLHDLIVSAVGRQLSPENDPRMRDEQSGLAGLGQRCYRTTKWLYKMQ